MIATAADFENESVWERTVLAHAVPMMPLTGSGADLDLRTKNITVRGVGGFSSSDEAVEAFRNKLLPLLFGAAWKVLDLTLELALTNAGLTPKDGKRWSIEEKAAEATKGKLPGSPIPLEVWQALGSLYGGTKELRHALVHRQVRVDASRALIGSDRQGNKLQAVSYDEQMAFCRLAQRLAEIAIRGSVPSRVEADLRGQLAILKCHHGAALGGAAAVRLPVRVIDALPSSRRLDVPRLMSEAARTFPGAQYVDLELHVEDGRILVGDLESAPQVPVTVDPASPPSWLQFS